MLYVQKHNNFLVNMVQEDKFSEYARGRFSYKSMLNEIPQPGSYFDWGLVNLYIKILVLDQHSPKRLQLPSNTSRISAIPWDQVRVGADTGITALEAEQMTSSPILITSLFRSSNYPLKWVFNLHPCGFSLIHSHLYMHVYIQLAAELHFNDVVLWPYCETLPSGTAQHFMLHVIYPRLRMFVTLDSDRGPRTSYATRLIRAILQQVDKYNKEPDNIPPWKGTIIQGPKQQSEMFIHLSPIHSFIHSLSFSFVVYIYVYFR
jgi:hypothetical protein